MFSKETSYRAAREGNVSVFAELLKTASGRALLATTNLYGNTSAYLAAEEGHTAVIAEFLKTENGRDLLAKPNAKGLTPAYIAAVRGHSAVIEVLLSTAEGRQLLTIPCKGFSPAYIAAYEGHPAVIEKLLTTAEGRSIVRLVADDAVKNNHVNVIKTIISVPEGELVLGLSDISNLSAQGVFFNYARARNLSINGHIAICDLGIELGYANDIRTGEISADSKENFENGLCHGISVSWMNACLINKQDVFDARIDRIQRESSTIVQQINAVKEKVTEHLILTDADMELLEINSLYDSISLHQSPEKISDWFEHSYEQKNIDNISLFSQSKALEEAGGLFKAGTHAVILSQPEMVAYFNELASTIAEKTEPLGYILTSFNHSISLYYNPKNKNWTCMDINQWPAKSDLSVEELVPLIRQSTGFVSHENSDYCCFKVTMLSTEHTKKTELTELVNGFKETHLIQPQRLKEISSESLSILDDDPETRLALIKDLSDHGQLLTSINNNELVCIAAAEGHAAIFEKLLTTAEGRELLTKSNSEDLKPAHIAAERGHAVVIEAFLKTAEGRRLLATPDTDGFTPAYLAAQEGHASVIEKFLATDEGRELLATPSNGYTPAYIAAHEGHASVIEKFLTTAEGRELLAIPCNEHTPLYIAIQEGHTAVVAMLENSNAKNQSTLKNELSGLRELTALDPIKDPTEGPKF